jgi:hypothetical protein
VCNHRAPGKSAASSASACVVLRSTTQGVWVTVLCGGVCMRLFSCFWKLAAPADSTCHCQALSSLALGYTPPCTRGVGDSVVWWCLHVSFSCFCELATSADSTCHCQALSGLALGYTPPCTRGVGDSVVWWCLHASFQLLLEVGSTSRQHLSLPSVEQSCAWLHTPLYKGCG